MTFPSVNRGAPPGQLGAIHSHLCGPGRPIDGAPPVFRGGMSDLSGASDVRPSLEGDAVADLALENNGR